MMMGRGSLRRLLLPCSSHAAICIIVTMVTMLMTNSYVSCQVLPPCCSPPTNVWCDYQQLPSTLPFVVTQQNWWNEYFLFSATQNATIGFKLYAGMASSEYFTMIIGTNYCPTFSDIQKNITNAWSYGTASLVIEVIEGNSYVVYGHMSGNNYTLMGCDGPCPEACPNDCTNFQGVCNATIGSCFCNEGWTGDNCSIVYTNTTTTNGTSPIPHHKIPFGSEVVFISIVAGLPTALLITVVSGCFIYLTYRKKEKKLKLKEEKQPLITPPYSPSNNDNNNNNNSNGINGYHHHHHNHHNHHHNGKDDASARNSLSLSPAFPPSPHHNGERPPSPSSPPSSPNNNNNNNNGDLTHRSPEEQQSLHKRNNNKT